MRVDAFIWTGTALFFAVLAGIYVAVGGEPAGTVLLAVGLAFAGLVAGWLWRRLAGGGPPRPEDRADGTMAEDAGPVGSFVTSSWRPIGIAAGMTVTVAGLAIGLWLAALGLALTAHHVLGLVREQP